jgi:hypothetical protein
MNVFSITRIGKKDLSNSSSYGQFVWIFAQAGFLIYFSASASLVGDVGEK